MVLAPTRELGQQILLVAKELSGFEKFSSAGLFGGTSMAKQAKRLGQVGFAVTDIGRALRNSLVQGSSEKHVWTSRPSGLGWWRSKSSYEDDTVLICFSRGRLD